MRGRIDRPDAQILATRRDRTSSNFREQDRLFELEQDFARAWKKRLTCGRYLDTACRSREKRRTEIRLDFANLLAERGLSHVQPLGRSTKMQLFGQGNKAFYASQLRWLSGHARIFIAAANFLGLRSKPPA